MSSSAGASSPGAESRAWPKDLLTLQQVGREVWKGLEQHTRGPAPPPSGEADGLWVLLERGRLSLLPALGWRLSPHAGCGGSGLTAPASPLPL